MTTVEVS